MDALRLLGSLLGNNATSSGQGEQILGQLIGGLMGGNTRSGGTGGGLADVLGGLMGGGAQSGRAGGGLADVLRRPDGRWRAKRWGWWRFG